VIMSMPWIFGMMISVMTMSAGSRSNAATLTQYAINEGLLGPPGQFASHGHASVGALA
jgi:hypothetical protein